MQMRIHENGSDRMAEEGVGGMAAEEPVGLQPAKGRDS